MADVKIRRMTWLDVEEVTKVEEASFSIPWTKEAFMNEMLRNEQAIYFVAVHDKRVVGFVGVWTSSTKDISRTLPSYLNFVGKGLVINC
jgi:ribosomal-protein-alanine N-acetyltransferase